MPEQPQPKKIKKNWTSRWWGILILLFLTAVILYLSFFVFELVSLIENRNNRDNSFANMLGVKSGSTSNTVARLRQLAEGNQSPFIGPADAKVVVVEFSDFQCPFCLQVHPVLTRLRQQYQDRVKFVYRDLPNVMGHPEALPSALAARCAAEQNKFWPYYDLLFNNQTQLGTDLYNDLAQQLNMDTAKFSDCLTSSKYSSNIQADLQDAVSLGLNGTPIFFINGTKLVGAVSYEELQAKINEALLANQ